MAGGGVNKSIKTSERLGERVTKIIEYHPMQFCVHVCSLQVSTKSTEKTAGIGISVDAAMNGLCFIHQQMGDEEVCFWPAMLTSTQSTISPLGSPAAHAFSNHPIGFHALHVSMSSGLAAVLDACRCP